MYKNKLSGKVFSALSVVLVLAFLFTGTGMSFGAEFSGDDKVVVVLDPGHGAYSTSNHSEGNYNLRVALKIKEELDANGSFSVYLTHGEEDGDISHYERARIADSVNADVMISIHFNASENAQVRGMEAWTSVIEKFNMDSLAQMFIDYALKAVPEIPYGGIFSRKDTSNFYWDEKYQWDIKDDSSSGVLSDYYGIITWGLKFGVPTFIIEEAYLSNEEDFAIVNSDETISKIAKAQAQAIIDYYTSHSHTYSSSFTTDIPASCISLGKQSRHCSVCGHRTDVGTITDEIDEDAHFMRIIEQVLPSGGNDGYTIWSCVYTDSLINKAKIEYEAHGGTTIIPASEHHEHNYIIVEAYQAYPGYSGSARYKCDLCGDTYTVTFPYGTSYCNENGHVPYPDDTVPEVQATCTEKGEKHYFCLACGEDLVEYTEPLGHSYETVAINSAKCEEEGSKVEKCTICADVHTSVISALGHNYETVITKAPTCTEKGRSKQVCRICGKESEEEEVPATGHIYGDGVVTKEAGLFTDGERVFTCSGCGVSYSEIISHTAPIGRNALILIIVLAVIPLLLGIAVISLKYGKRKSSSEAKQKGPKNKKKAVDGELFKDDTMIKEEPSVPDMSKEKEIKQEPENQKEPVKESKNPKSSENADITERPKVATVIRDRQTRMSVQSLANAMNETKEQAQKETDDKLGKSVADLLKKNINDAGKKIDKNP